MPSTPSKRQRAILAIPFLGLTLLCLQVMDIEKMVAHQEPFLRSRKIKWSNGSIPILSHFHYAEFLNELWRGTTVSFSPSTLGYDVVSSWQMFSFLNDLGSVYVVWLLESSRVGNAWTPAYLWVHITYYFPSNYHRENGLSNANKSTPARPYLLLRVSFWASGPLRRCSIFSASLSGPQPRLSSSSL
ncbi:hypothetical protein I7I50_00289 [Histoplasma capsulatum G186AR]|uniref:Mannosyltransferase n=1 Tax=Ajellomyces capsulatus TaxID=5037 RepID=A0A8H7YFX2_AJECA|nr:hypothetical protein I7I52_07557 [Histoplasma capsulatum]QSS72439.1 hypothetical protein I7I50_00289 [Histoplasma capsulatum G186AR]